MFIWLIVVACVFHSDSLKEYQYTVFSIQNAVYSLDKGGNFDKRRYFANTKLLAGNDHAIDIFTSEDLSKLFTSERKGKYLTV